MTEKEFFKEFYNCNLEEFLWSIYSWELAKKYSTYFEILFNPNKFNWFYSWSLCQYCSKYFEKWYNPNKFDWRQIYFLKKHCRRYRHIWLSEYLLRKIL